MLTKAAPYIDPPSGDILGEASVTAQTERAGGATEPTATHEDPFVRLCW